MWSRRTQCGNVILHKRKEGQHFCCPSFLSSGRDDKTRTCDLAPPRRVRYQLRYIPLPFARGEVISSVCGAKVRHYFVLSKFICTFVHKNKINISAGSYHDSSCTGNNKDKGCLACQQEHKQQSLIVSGA